MGTCPHYSRLVGSVLVPYSRAVDFWARALPLLIYVCTPNMINNVLCVTHLRVWYFPSVEFGVEFT